MIVLIWGGVALLSDGEDKRAYEVALVRADDLTRTFEAYISRVVKGTDSALLALRQSYERDPQNLDLKRWVADTNFQNDLVVQFSLTGADGVVKASSLGLALPAINVADRDHFRVAAASVGDELYISRPVVGRVSERTTIQLARKLRTRGGAFDGIIVASLDVIKLERFYNSVEVGRSGVISLVGFDGIIRARSSRDSAPGELVGHSVDNSKLMRVFRQSPSGSYWNFETPAGLFDGYRRLISYRVIEGLPLIALVGLSEDDIFEHARIEQGQYRQAGMGLTAMVLLVIVFGIARQHKLLSASAALQRSEASLKQNNEWFAAALDNMSHGLCMFDRDQRLIVCNRRYAEMYGLTLEQARPGVTLRSILEARVAVGHSPEETEAYVERRLREVDGPESHNVVDELRDGRSIAISHQPMRHGGWVAIHQDITENRRAETQIAYMATHDALTGLVNRTLLTEKIVEAGALVRRHGAGFSVLMLDLDNFKDVNDSLGHPAGDALLKEVARRLRTSLRETDVLARLGGDEFAILQSGEQSPRDGAIKLAARIIGLIARPFDLDGRRVSIGTSIGIAVAPQDGMEPDDLLKRADLALYRTKAQGRNGFNLFDAVMTAEAEARQQLESDLRDAFARNELELHYQPLIDVATGEPRGAEALLRWRHPDKGQIAPDRFIPLAENSGFIVELGSWVLRRACTDAAAWPAHIRLAVNLSPVQFRRGNLFGTVMAALAESGLPPNRLEIEITESLLLEGDANCRTVLGQLKDIGVSIALDDFGTGFSSLGYVTRFPVDRIKIDKSFTQGLATRADCAAVVACVVTLARGLEIETTAEGVETSREFELLRAAGVNQVQGYLFARPCPASELDFDRTAVVGKAAAAAA
jgi:diguanylate cyclase (GGDEF)-like protein/PAS domain S-box-containing protein